MKVGFIGLGIMGKPMARNIMKAGYELTVHTNNVDTIAEFAKDGAEGASNAREVAEKSEVIVLMLPNSPNVEDVIFGENGLFEGLSEGKTIIDMSSINPVESQRFAFELEKIGVNFLDAPVSGGEPGAIEGTISVMVGGKEEVFNKYYNLMSSMATSVVRVGDVGAGGTTKLANQIIVAVNIAAVSEAFILAEKTKTDPNLVYEAIRAGLAGSRVLEQKGPKMLNRNYDPGFRIDLHIKDLQNAIDTSHSVQASLPFTALVMEIMQSLRIHGDGQDDHSAIVKYYERINDIKVGD